MTLEERASKGASTLTDWLRGLSTRKRVQDEPINETSLLFQLPDELFIKVFSNFPTFQLGNSYYRINRYATVKTTRYLSRRYGARHRILLAFTQLCRPMRQKFLPWLWEHVQSLCVRVRPPGLDERECRRLAKLMFRRQSRTLIATPSLAAHVKVFSVHVLSNASGLAKLLPLLPNLDTLEVLNGEDTGSSIEHSFKPIRLPQIRMLVIDAGIHYLMKSCTNVKRIVIEHKRFNDSYLESIPFIAGSLVSLALCFPEPQNIRDLVRLCPNLEELGLIQTYSFLVSDCITAAQGFMKLRLLEVVLSRAVDWDSSNSEPRPVWESLMKDHAITVLGNIHGHAKVLKMISVGNPVISPSGWEEDIHDIVTQIVEVS